SVARELSNPVAPPARGRTETLEDLARELQAADPRRGHHDVHLCVGHVEVAVDDRIRVPAKVAEQLAGHRGAGVEAPSDMVDVLKAIATVLADPEMVRAKERERVDAMALGETHTGSVSE